MGALLSFIANAALLYIIVGFILYIIFMITTLAVFRTFNHRKICALLEERYDTDLSRMKQEGALSAQTKVFLLLVVMWLPMIFSEV